MKIPLLIAALLFAGTAVAQTGEQRGSAPLGTSQDGSKPADGAIKGGTIAPGESAGMPTRKTERCYDLSGTLREDCLKQEREAAGGETKLPLPPEPAPSDSRTRSRERAD
ncbi:MAG TPA: hypothetical protein VNC62_11045 [Burkholderiales bacterium]|jgi:hypothetical protein|nr:hypothetical protein [Burkholderiales bacterium]HVJ25805.1 hypothetical protein [Burkholderiales bacterium]